MKTRSMWHHELRIKGTNMAGNTMIVPCCVVLSVSSFIELVSGCLFSLGEHQHAKVAPVGVRDQDKYLTIREIEYRHTSTMSCEPFDMDADACTNPKKILLGRLGSADHVWLPRGGGRERNTIQQDIVIGIGLG